MKIKEFYKLKIGDKVIRKGKVLIVKKTSNNNFFDNDPPCFDVTFFHESTNEITVLCGRLNYNAILHSLTKIKS